MNWTSNRSLTDAAPILNDQTRFGADGNCFAACLATLLGLDMQEVPEANEWLRQRGLALVVVDVKDKPFYRLPPGVPVILGGVSPRNPEWSHAVVGMSADDGWNYDILHDPHPSRDGIGALQDVSLLIPLRPWQRDSRESEG